MTDRNIKGLKTELLCQYYLTSLGYNVSIPLGEDCKYDMIADFNGTLIRIQAKACTEEKNGVEFSVCSNSLVANGPATIRSYTKEDIDFFAIFYKDKMYMVPVEECGTSTKLLSFNTSIYSSSKQSILEDYEAEKQIQRVLDGEMFLEQIEKKKILQYDLNGHFINSYNSGCEAAIALGKRKEHATHIAQVCKGIRRTAYGYIWKYSN